MSRFGARPIVLVQILDTSRANFAWPRLSVACYSLKNNEIRFGVRIALLGGVTHKAQAQGETVESALFPRQAVTSVKFLEVSSELLTIAP